MNQLQMEMGLIPAKILKEDKEDPSIFRRWMTGLMIRNLRHDIDTYLLSVNDESVDGSLSAAALAARIGITPKAVEKHLARLKAEGILRRIGPDKGGHWTVNDHR